jgi:SAM-dependent methyltransferase
MARYSEYDRFAQVYNRHWGSKTLALIPVFEKLVLQHLPAGAHILDLCCGTGQIANALAEQGYRITGIDSSEQMIALAHRNAPGATFVVDDARTFQLDDSFQAVLSIFDSLNHMMTLDDLAAVFRRVYAALETGGWFLFDLNTEEGFKANWQGSFGIVEDDAVIVAQSGYEPETRVGTFEVTLMLLEGGVWQRSDLRLTQRCYAEEDILDALHRSGFGQMQALDSAHDLNLGLTGRCFFVCRRRK